MVAVQNDEGQVSNVTDYGDEMYANNVRLRTSLLISTNVSCSVCLEMRIAEGKKKHSKCFHYPHANAVCAAVPILNHILVPNQKVLYSI